jgi:predicted DNA-binding transcriptional regulator AlpA
MEVATEERKTLDGQSCDHSGVEPLLVDCKMAARMIGVGVSTFYAMDRSGELGPQGLRLRRRRLWSREELTAWVRAGCPRREIWASMSKTLKEST